MNDTLRPDNATPALWSNAAPAVRQWGQKVSAAGQTLHAKADRLREKRGEWAEGLRTTVRSNPLAAVAAALALGAVISGIAHIVRSNR